MTRGFWAVSAALLVATIMLSPAMAYTICSSANPSYTIGTGSPYQYTMGSGGLQAYTIGTGTPYQYTIDSSALQAYSIGTGTPYQYTMGSSGLQAYTVSSGTPQYTMGSSGLQAYTIGMGTPAASTGSCEVTTETPVVEETPVVNETATVEETTAAPEEPVLMNIIETATAAGNLNILVTAVDATGLTEALSGDGPFTVFAPTDDAFALANLDMNDTEALIKILNYHVVIGEYMAADLANVPTVTTLSGEDLMITAIGENLIVNDANIVQTDVVCSNGVIQVIDAVLTLPEEEIPVEVLPANETTVDEPPADEIPVEVPQANETTVEEPPVEVTLPTE